MKISFFLPLLVLTMGSGVGAAPLTTDGRHVFEHLVLSLSQQVPFAELESQGASIVEIVDFDAGLFVRYQVGGQECLGKMVMNSPSGKAVFDPDLRCSTKVQGARTNDSNFVSHLIWVKSIMRFLNHQVGIEPPVGRVRSVRREGSRWVLVYHTPQNGRTGATCTLALVPPPSGRPDSSLWRLVDLPTCATM